MARNSTWNRAVADLARDLGIYELVVKQHWHDLDRTLAPTTAVQALLGQLGSGSPTKAPNTTKAARKTVAAAPRPFARTGSNLYQWQQEALTAWEAADRQGVVQAVTGTGKTRLGIEAAFGELRAGGQVLVVVPTRTLLNQWHSNLEDTHALRAANTRVGLLGDGRSANFTGSDLIVSTIQSADGLRPPTRGLIVADECHRYGSDAWFNALHPQFSARLGLTATYERGDDGDSRLALYFGDQPVYDIAYERAIRDDVVARFKLAFVGARLSPQDKTEYENTEAKLKKSRSTLVGGFRLRADPHADFMKDVAKAAAGKWPTDPGGARQLAIRYMSAFQRRARILAESEAKTRRLADLRPVAESARGTLIFTQTISAATTAAELYSNVGQGAAVISSELSSDERERLLTSFREGGKSVITAPRVLDEGVDVPDADLAIVVTASSSRRQMIQRMGRVLRKKQDGRLARMVILYAEGTIEDPSKGAHESFNDIAWDVADSAMIFGSHKRADDIHRFLLEPSG